MTTPRALLRTTKARLQCARDEVTAALEKIQSAEALVGEVRAAPPRTSGSTFGQRFKELRTAAGLTQTDVAEQSNLDILQQTVGNWETGKTFRIAPAHVGLAAGILAAAGGWDEALVCRELLLGPVDCATERR